MVEPYVIRNTQPNNEDLEGWASCDFQPADLMRSLSISPGVRARDVLKFTIMWVLGQRYRSYSEDVSLQMRRIALKFVTEWLGHDPESNNNDIRIPSLSTLCAQKLASKMAIPVAEKFEEKLNIARPLSSHLTGQKFCDSIDTWLSEKLENEKGIPSHSFIQKLLLQELYIFIIVYMLYCDLRELKSRPYSEYSLRLPVDIFEDREDYFRWLLDTISLAVPNKGRGRLAKLAVLPYCVLLNYINTVSNKNYTNSMRNRCSLFCEDDKHPYNYMEVVGML